MRSLRSNKTRSLLLVGVWINRNWILGNWVKEIALRGQGAASVHWTFSVSAQKHFWEKFVKFPLPKYGAYFFSYPSMFESYLKSNPKRYRLRSIVNYTHNMDELGDLTHQAQILNEAHSIHFNCSANSDSLVNAGLDPEKVRLVFGAVDSDCCPQADVKREARTILLASKYSERKGLSILPQVVSLLPEWKFIILGRGWEEFLKESNLDKNPNVEYFYFTKGARNIAMSRAGLFLSLSKLEGGPIPLIESMRMGVIPVATDTGFARDLILDGKNGIVIPNPPTAAQVHKAILLASELTGSPQESVEHLSWERLANIVMGDAEAIWNKESLKFGHE
jgi:glycosyltransferase involved in cell wall biosynthesis